MLDIIKAYAVNNLCYKTSKKMTPKGIVVHSTGADNPNLKRYVDAPDEVGVNSYGNHWNVEKPSGRSVCVHAFIGYDKDNKIRVAQLLPLDICCWGVGKGRKGSYNFAPPYIQFEICEDGLSDKTYYRKAFDAAIEYCAELCRQYKIDVSNIVGHCEAYRQGYGSNHSDPEHWMKRHGETMQDFRNSVSAILKIENDKTENKTESIENSSDVSQSVQLQKGDLVSVVSDAVYYGGKSVPDWVKTQRWYIKELKGERAVIDMNEKGTKFICSPIHKKYLVPVNGKENIDYNSITEKASKCPYLVRINTASLNIRKGCGTNTPKVGVITDKGVYTIVEEKQGIGASLWGKLKSGAGWISLDYTEKV